MAQGQAIFLVNLLQDVNIVRPLVYMASRDLALRTEILVTKLFITRDRSALWQGELDQISRETGTPVQVIENRMDAVRLLQCKAGILIAASESNLSAHAPTHEIFRFAPPSFIKVTLQHGLECVGFLQSREHDLAHGRQVSFAADILCSWMDKPALTAMLPSQMSKVYVTGAPGVLQMRMPGHMETGRKTGLVCENLHSPRMNAGGDFKTDFVQIFRGFCGALAQDGSTVTLRPHPGGQFVLRNNVELPSNVILNNNPIYKVDLSRYAYGISAPSSVLIDMVLAEIPVAVWRDEAGTMDAGNYRGLTMISTLQDWIEFTQAASADPQKFISLQRRFLENLGMQTDPQRIYHRFYKLLAAASVGMDHGGAGVDRTGKRILFFGTDPLDATLNVCLLRPLAELIDGGEIAGKVITIKQMTKLFREQIQQQSVKWWLDTQIALFRPSVIIFCRYNGPHARHIVEQAKSQQIPVIYHIDDDLLNVPLHLGEKKYKFHNSPERLDTVRYLLDNADLVYCSTPYLMEHFRGLGVQSRLTAGQINCSGRIINPARQVKTARIGYMGFDKTAELEYLLPVIVPYLREYPHVEFELFGSFVLPPVLEEFGNRIRLLAPVRGYDSFLEALSSRAWDIGICPLATTAFNLKKSNIKWVEYTSVGTAVIASKGTVYDECCADDCGILATTPDEWSVALRRLTDDPALRYALVKRAQARLEEEYTVDRLRNQVLGIIEQVKAG